MLYYPQERNRPFHSIKDGYMNKFYITTAIPYVNAKPHVGHALEFVQTDTIARYRRLVGDDVLLLSGGDENALKNVQAAEKNGQPIQEFIDTNAAYFADIAKALDVHFDVFQKGSNTKTHFPSSQKLWELCDAAGDIYKKTYSGLYCVGCEQFYTQDELNENGECFEHPGKALESVSEENYFFRLSRYQQQLIELIETDTLKIYPLSRKNEVLSFLRTQTLQDISISRSNERAKNWGVPVPNDPSQRIYVWFDALNIYQSGVGFGSDDAQYAKWWPADVHVIGKGIIRFHAVYWPAFLLSAKLKLPKALFVHGYFTVNGQKMSKTIGNVIDPNDVIARYGVDFTRFYFLYELPTFDDGDFSYDRADQLYTAEFANGIGNLVSRICALCAKSGASFPVSQSPAPLNPVMVDAFSKLDLREALRSVWQRVWDLNKTLSDDKPWEKDGAMLGEYLQPIVSELRAIVYELQPFTPTLATKIAAHLATEHIEKITPLFPKLV